jgi:hypothetical protein
MVTTAAASLPAATGAWRGRAPGIPAPRAVTVTLFEPEPFGIRFILFIGIFEDVFSMLVANYARRLWHHGRSRPGSVPRTSATSSPTSVGGQNRARRILIVYYDVLAYSSLVEVADMLIDARFKLEERHESMTEDMRRMDAKYEELPCRASWQVR